jgi:hypothetical protein
MSRINLRGSAIDELHGVTTEVLKDREDAVQISVALPETKYAASAVVSPIGQRQVTAPP